MSDSELLLVLEPCLKDCPPVDILLVEESRKKLEIEKQAKKDLLKAEKKLKGPLDKIADLEKLAKAMLTKQL